MRKRWWVAGVVSGALTVFPAFGYSAEHGGKEHGGQEHGGQQSVAAPEPSPAAVMQAQEPQPAQAGPVAQVEPSAEQIRQAIRDYISQVEQEEGAFSVDDEVTGKIRTLTLDRVHERVGKTGDLYYSCTDMKDSETGEMLDLDFDVEAKDDQLNVVDVRIHKVNGQPRYTYDDKDNRIPLM